MKKTTVLVVDDSAYNRTVITRMLEQDAEIEVIETAGDGVDAIAKTVRLIPDVITLDLEMPMMDGFTFLRWLMKERPTPVLVLSSRSDSRSVFQAMELGAVDFLAKPEARISKSIEAIAGELIAKVHAVRDMEMHKVKSAIGLLAREAPAPFEREEIIPGRGAFDVVAVASSTGGPPALQAILSVLPAALGAGIVISQHMPPGFTRSFAERLNKLSLLSVTEAAAGDLIEPGRVLIAPGGHHLIVKREARGLAVELQFQSGSDKYVPSADRMMISVAETCGPSALGVVLTGMGNDGAEGARAIKKKGGKVLAESEESAVIFGMPREAIRTGSVDKVLPLSMIAQEIAARCRGEKGGSDNSR